AALSANALMFAVAGVVALRPFFGKLSETPVTPHEAGPAMLAGPLILGTLGLLIGIFPEYAQALVTPTVAAVTGGAVEARELKIWAGVNLALYLSLATFALGAVIYIAHRSIRRSLARADEATLTLDEKWDGFMDGLKAGAKAMTARIQTGRLKAYVFATFSVVFVGLAATIALRMDFTGWEYDIFDASWKNIAIVIFILLGAIGATITSSRVTAMAALGIVGIGVALIFIVFGAPDVAITQLLVETLVVVLVAVALLRLPVLDSQGRIFRPWDAALGIGVGTVTTLILLGVLQAPIDLRLSEYFAETAWPEAYGRNIVNVILVDFRALDTFGEIAVVVIAALSSYALLRTTADDRIWERSKK
ncbi:MAG: hydrogen gas-evolving membrane-bound hydrogenase subunit E, partial [Shimia sp.]